MNWNLKFNKSELMETIPNKIRRWSLIFLTIIVIILGSYYSILHSDIFLLEKIVAILIAIIFLYINYRGASETGKIGALFTFGQILFLVIIGIIGVIFTMKDPERLSNFKTFMPNGWIKILAAMGLTYVAFEGYEVIAQAGDETINPKKNLPKAILLSVLIVTIIYVFIAFTGFYFSYLFPVFTII